MVVPKKRAGLVRKPVFRRRKKAKGGVRLTGISESNDLARLRDTGNEKGEVDRGGALRTQDEASG